MERISPVMLEWVRERLGERSWASLNSVL